MSAAAAGPGVPPTQAGLALGAGFMGLAWGVAGPALRLTPPPTEDTLPNHVKHVVVHALFGLATAWVTEQVQREAAARQSAAARR